MATRVENREVTVLYCDQCGKEAEHLQKCVVCKRELCPQNLENDHFGYSLGVYRYTDHRGERREVKVQICRDCGNQVPTVTIKEFLDSMFPPLGK